MTVSNEKLVRMAEQITANLAYTDDSQVVALKVADHLGRFWDPRMLNALRSLASEQPDALSPALLAAVAVLD